MNMLAGQLGPMQSSHLSTFKSNRKLTRTAMQAAAATHG